MSFLVSVSCCQATLTRGGAMKTTKNLKGAGLAYLGAGTAFFIAALAAGQTAFIGVGAAFIALGVVFLGKSRQDG